ncbi:hypothetical protein, partial [Paracraurococcus lichenis]
MSPDVSASPDADWLSSMLSQWRDEGPPIPLPPESPPLVSRDWDPISGPREASMHAAILRRHPELTFAFSDLPVLRMTRHRVPFGWGIKKEFASQVTNRDVFAHSSL